MAINFTTANGLTKIIYEDSGYTSLVPASDLLAQDFPYKQKDSPGRSFNYSVMVSSAGGFGYGGQDSDVLSLPTSISAHWEPAIVKPYLYGFRQEIGYGLFSQLGKIKSKKVQKQAFLSGTQAVMQSMKESASFQRELALYHGQSLLGIGVITGSVVSGSGTGTQVWGISDATFNESLLFKAVNMRLDAYDTTGATKRNTANTITLSSVDVSNKRVTLVGNAAELDTIVATDALHIEGSISNSMYGLHKALANSTGTYLGLSATTYPLWASNQYAFGNNRVNVSRVGDMVNLVSARGQKGDLTLYLNRLGMHDLQQSLSGQIFLNNNPSSFENAVTTIKVAGRTVHCKVHDYELPGYCQLVPTKGCCVRIGPEDLSFKNPVTDAYFEPMQGDLGAEIKCWGNQALIVKNPAHCCQGSGIKNSTD